MGVRFDDDAAARPSSKARSAGAILVLAISALGMAACSSGAQDPSDSGATTTSAEERVEERVSHTGPEPTAMSYTDGVEVWDLTVEPSVEAFGINWPDRTDRGL